MAEEGSDSGVESNIASEHKHINPILDYVLHQRYPPGCSKNIKRDIRKLSQKYVARGGQLYYLHKPAREPAKELQVIIDSGAKLCIIKSMHEGSGELHRLTGTEQRVTSAYHPQTNGLVYYRVNCTPFASIELFHARTYQ